MCIKLEGVRGVAPVPVVVVTGHHSEIALRLGARTATYLCVI